MLEDGDSHGEYATTYSAVQTIEDDGRVMLRRPQPLLIVHDVDDGVACETESDVELGKETLNTNTATGKLTMNYRITVY